VRYASPAGRKPGCPIWAHRGSVRSPRNHRPTHPEEPWKDVVGSIAWFGFLASVLLCAIGSARRSGRAPRGGRNGRGDSRSPSDPVRGECPFASIDLAERDRVGSTPEVFWDVVCESSIAQPRAALQGPVRLSPGTGRATPGVTHTSSQVGVAADAGSAAQCAAAPESVPAERRHLLIDSARGGRAGLGPTRPPPPAYGVSLLIRVYQFASETRVAPQLPKPTALGGLG